MMQNENKSDHHCHLYKNNILIVRRAQEFQMTLQFNQPVNPSDNFQIEFYIGKTFLHISTNVVYIPFCWIQMKWHALLDFTDGDVWIIVFTIW